MLYREIVALCFEIHTEREVHRVDRLLNFLILNLILYIEIARLSRVKRGKGKVTPVIYASYYRGA
jgi:hypothetical protein